MPPLVAIVGRPNVGKSTLFNRLLGRRAAIVHDLPGVTRDRHYGHTELHGRSLVLVDTGGFEPETDDSLKAKMRAQAELAIEEADSVLLLFDVQEGLTPADSEVASLLRRAGKPVLHVVNKADSERREIDASDFYRLGVEELFPVSAEHGRGVSELVDRLLEELPAPDPADELAEPEDLEDLEPPEEGEAGEHEAQVRDRRADRPLRIAVVGVPNAGKSSLVNRLLGGERVIAHDRPGTTRDSVDLELVRGDRTYVLVDTAGLRQKRKTYAAAEKIAAIKALQAMNRADVAILLVDASRGVADQEAKIAGHAVERGCGLILAINKWDLVEADDEFSKEEQGEKLVTRTVEKLHFVDFAPLRRISATTGRGCEKLLEMVDEVAAARAHRVPTAELNRFFERVVEHHDPPRHRGRDVRFYFISQFRVRPPTFALVCNQPEGVPTTYRRYILNALRAAYGFAGTPLRLKIRGKNRRGK